MKERPNNEFLMGELIAQLRKEGREKDAEITKLKAGIISAESLLMDVNDVLRAEIAELEARIEQLTRHWYSGPKKTPPPKQLAKIKADAIREMLKIVPQYGRKVLTNDIDEYADNLEK